MAEQSENYELVLTAKIEEFAAKMKQAVRDLTAVTEANKKLAKEEAKLSPAQKARFETARQLRMERTRERNIVLEMASLEERRLRLQQLLNRAVASGNTRRSAILRSGLSATSAELALRQAGSGSIGGSGGSGGRGSGFTQALGAAAGVAGAGAIGGAISLGGRAGPLAAAAILVRSFMGLTRAATEMSASAQAQQEAAKATYQWSQGTIETLAGTQTAAVTAWEAVKKVIGEGANILVNTTGLLVTRFLLLWTKFSIFSGAAPAIEEAQARMLGRLPTWAGGLGGLGESGVAEAEGRLAEAKKRRMETDAKITSKKATPVLSGFDFASTFSSGAKGAGYVSAGMAQWAEFGNVQKAMLAELKANTAATKKTTDAIKDTL